MVPFDLAEPKTLAEAIKLLDPDDPTVRPFGGCTALMLMMKAGVFQPAKLVSLRKVEPKYSSIAVEGGGLRIGALATLASLERSDEVKKHLPLVSRTLLTLSNIRVRNVATVGGALAHGDPHMDLPPVLMALGATVTIAGPKGERTSSLEDMLTGYYETSLGKDELITSVLVPSQGKKRGSYMKVTTGSADDWPALGVAAVLDAEGSAVKSANIVVSAATTKATRIAGAEALLKGKASMLGAASGAVAGLVAITPACGYVGPMGSIVIGLAAGLLCLWGVTGLKKMLGADDSLDVFGVHGVGGILGALLTGVFAAPSLGGTGIFDYVANAASPDYSIAGQVWIQFQAVVTTLIWSGVVSVVAYKLVDMVVGLRVTEEEEREGLDISSHGESAYNR